MPCNGQLRVLFVCLWFQGFNGVAGGPYHQQHGLIEISPELNGNPPKLHLRPPVIVEDPADVIVKRHEPTTLRCRAEGIPMPSISWFKHDRKVHPTSNIILLPNGDLFFLFVEARKKDPDTGVYYCVARNELGEATSQYATVALEHTKPQPQHQAPRIIEHPPKHIVVNKGDSVTLACHIEGKPSPVIEWHRNGQRLRDSENDHVILPGGSLFFLHVNADSGIYWCTGRNDLGHVKSHQCLLEVIQPNVDGSNSQIAPTLADGQEAEPQPHLFWQPWFIVIEVLIVLFVTSSAILIFLMRQIAHSNGGKRSEPATDIMYSKPVDGHFLYRTHPLNKVTLGSDASGDGHVYENKMHELDTYVTDTESFSGDAIYEEVSSPDRTGTLLSTFRTVTESRSQENNNQHREQQQEASPYAVSALYKCN